MRGQAGNDMVAPAPLQPAAANVDTTALLARIQALELRCGQLSEETHNCFGLVDGGEAGVVKLFKTYPTSFSPDPGEPVAQAKKGRWLKIVYPRRFHEHIGEGGGTVVDTWYCVQVLNAKTADIQSMWTCDKVADGPAFQRFDFYARDTAAVSTPPF